MPPQLEADEDELAPYTGVLRLTVPDGKLARALPAWAVERGIGLDLTVIPGPPPEYPCTCRRGHVLHGPDDRVTRIGNGRLFRWCRFCLAADKERNRMKQAEKRKANRVSKATGDRI